MGSVLCRWFDTEVLLSCQSVHFSCKTVGFGMLTTDISQVKRISLSKNILRAIDANPDVPPLASYPRSHQVSPLLICTWIHIGC